MATTRVQNMDIDYITIDLVKLYPQQFKTMINVDIPFCIEESRRGGINSSKIIRKWFKRHVLELKKVVGENVTIEIVGSRRDGVDIAYPESNIDIAFIAPSLDELMVIKHKLLDANQKGEIYPGCKMRNNWGRSCEIDNFSTIFIEHGRLVVIGDINLSISFRLTKTHEQIQEYVQNTMNSMFKSDESIMEKYVSDMRILRIVDPERFIERKAWLRILPLDDI